MVRESLHDEAEKAIGDVIEGSCPLCRVGLTIHDGRACCRCCGDSYLAAENRLEIMQCPEHGRRCEHWEAVYNRTRPS